MISRKQYLQALIRVAQYEQEQKKRDANPPPPKYSREDKLKWWHNMTEEEQTAIEKRYGYYGHDIGITEMDVQDLFDIEIKKR